MFVKLLCSEKSRAETGMKDTDKKTIKINFLDFWPDLDPKDNYFTNILSEHFDVELSDNPDYVICSEFGYEHTKPKYRNCIKIMFSGENLVPDFNSYDYAIGFHHIDFEDRYLRLPLYVLYTDIIDKALNKHEITREDFLKRKGFCSYVISNPDASEARDGIIDSLSEYKELASGGRYRNNVGGPVKDKLAFIGEYRFSLAIENSCTSGYTTEKILQAFAAGTVPIYWGDPRIKQEFNEKSFIYAGDFDNYDELRAYVKDINEDDEKYLAMAKAPIITDDSKAAKYFEKKYAEEFLLHIFEQPLEKAYRRNMVYFGRRYQNRMRDLYRVQKVIDVIGKPVHLCKKIFRQITSK